MNEEETTDVGAVLYKKGDEKFGEDMWDDTALISAYDKAVNLTYEKVEAQLKGVKQEKDSNKQEKPSSSTNNLRKKKKARSKKGKNSTRKWNVGDLCMAPYSEDDELYEANITKIDDDSQTCIVFYVGYEEEEEHNLSALREVSWRESGAESSVAEEGSVEDLQPPQFLPPPVNQFSMNTGFKIPAFPPPPPPKFLPSHRTPSSQEAVSTMLMAWYMSGYHTGYYQALNDMEKNNPGSSKRRNC